MNTATDHAAEVNPAAEGSRGAENPQSSGDFESTKAIAAPPEAVLAALRTPRGIADWWGATEGSTAVGGTFVVSFRSHQQVIVMRVEPSEEGQVVWSVLETPRTPDWVGTTIVFAVTPSGDGSVLHFRHRGLTPELDCYDMCHEGWTHYLASLVSYVETGAGHPSRHDDAA